MFQIIFTPVSTSEISALPTLVQLQVLKEFQNLTPDFLKQHPAQFSLIEQGDKKLYRYRAGDYRVYFTQQPEAGGIRIERVLNKNTLKDFFYRSQLPMSEDDGFENNPKFWAFLDGKVDGKEAAKK